MLSEVDILRTIESGELVITPFQKSSLRPAGLLLHLGEELLRPLPGKAVDVKNKILPDYEPIRITDEEPYWLEPGGFVLGHTFERVTVGLNLGFFIEGRSTLARVGLTVVQTAMIVYPGHRDRAVTLELANHGPNPVLLYPKMKIARAALFALDSPSITDYDRAGKYRFQSAVGAPVFEDEFYREDEA